MRKIKSTNILAELVAYVLVRTHINEVGDTQGLFDILFILRKIKSTNILVELVACVLEPILVG